MFLNTFSRIVHTFYDKAALCFEGASMSYAQLDLRSSRVGYALAAGGVGRGDIIVICLPHGFEAVCAMLGVLKAGAAIRVVEEGYLPALYRKLCEITSATLINTYGRSCSRR